VTRDYRVVDLSSWKSDIFLHHWVRRVRLCNRSCWAETTRNTGTYFKVGRNWLVMYNDAIHTNYCCQPSYCHRKLLKERLHSFSNFTLVTAVGGWPKSELCFLPGRLRWTLLPKGATAIHSEATDRSPNLPIESWTQPLNYRRPILVS